MQVGDLVTMRYSDYRHEGKPKPNGIVVAVDPEELGDEEEVAVLWTYIWCGEANHSTDSLKVMK